MPRADFMLNRNYTFDTSQITCRGLTNAILSLFLSFTKSLECVLCARTQHVCRWQISKYTELYLWLVCWTFQALGLLGYFLIRLAWCICQEVLKRLPLRLFHASQSFFRSLYFCLSVSLSVSMSVSLFLYSHFVSSSLPLFQSQSLYVFKHSTFSSMCFLFISLDFSSLKFMNENIIFIL